MDRERISLENQRSYDLFREELLPDGFAGLERLKSLRIKSCDTEECLANAPATIVFPVLEELDFFELSNLRQICRGPVPEGSFGELTSIEIRDCYRLEYLFPLQIVGCLTQLKRLNIERCTNMKEVIWKEQGDAHIPEGSFGELTSVEIRGCNSLEYLFPLQIVGCLTQLIHLTIRSCPTMKAVIWKEQGDTHIATNGIEFRNLEFLNLVHLPNLVGFCTGIDQINFPKLRCMHLERFSKRLFDIKSSLSSISEKNFDVGKQILDSPNASSIFPQKVTFPCLEDLSLECLRYSELQISPLLTVKNLTVKKLVVIFCYNLRYVFNSSMTRHLVHLKELNISICSKMDAVVDWEEEIEDGQERKVDTTLFPQLRKLQLNDLLNLKRFCHFTHTLELPMLSELDIRQCPSMEEFSLGHVSTPNLSLSGISWNGYLNPDISWNGDLNNALRLLQEKAKAKRERAKGERAKGKRFVVVEEDLKKQYRVAVDDIHDEDDLKKRRRVADQGEPHSIQASEIYEPAPNIEHENVRDGGRHEHLEDSYKMEVDSCESDSSIEKNNMIPWRETLPPNPQRGRCICFRTADLYTGESVITRFYSVPFDFFGDGGDDDDVNSSSSDVEGLKCFYECTDFATTSRLSSVGSSLFVVGASEETTNMYRFDTTAPENDWYKWDELSMCTPRAFPITVTMDGKLYIFGGSGPDAPLAELFDPCQESSTSTCVPLPLPERFPKKAWRHLVVAALQPSKKILVASGLSSNAYVYNVVVQDWEKFDHKVDFSSVRGQAAVVHNGNVLCWSSNNVEEIHAYHLVHKRWFKSPIKGLDEIGMRDPDGPAHYCPIFPLDDNHLCLLWKDHMGYNGTNLPLLRCIKIQVSIDLEESRFDAVVVASRTYALGPHESIFDAHVFLQDDDEGGERSNGLGGHDNGGSKRSGYGGGRRTVSSIAPFKICSKCWGTGHTESGCNQVISSSPLEDSATEDSS